MAAHAIAATNVWLDGEDWSWPGARPVELGPPAWVPALPLVEAVVDPPPLIAPARVHPVAPAAAARRFTGAAPAAEAPARPRPPRRRSRWWAAGARVWACAALALVFAATYALAGHLDGGGAGGVVAVPGSGPAAGGASTVRGTGASSGAAAGSAAAAAVAGAAALSATPTTVTLVGRDATGGSLEQLRYTSTALRRRASFFVYLPPGYVAGGAHRYPVLYLLHGDDQLADAWQQFGLTDTLDTVIRSGKLQPLIAVIEQGARRTENWRNIGANRYEDYVMETQQLADRMLPTIADRRARAIIGFSMGGYGAMHIALRHLDAFSVVESWLGFFNNLDGELRADAPQLHSQPLTAFVYGAASDTIADPSENGPWAAQLRAAGATAQSAVYKGEHDFTTLRAHLRHMLIFAGHSLQG